MSVIGAREAADLVFGCDLAEHTSQVGQGLAAAKGAVSTMRHVFVSYAPEDADFAMLVADELARQGFSTWRKDASDANGNPCKEVDIAIREALAVVAILSPVLAQSTAVNYEWAFALGSRTPVLPVLLDVGEADLHPRLRTLQYLDFSKRGDALPTRARHYRAHRQHLDAAGDYDVDVVTAGTLVADDGETPVGSVFVIDAADRATADAFTRSDPYHVAGVWERVQIHRYNRKRGTPIAGRR